MMTKRKKKRKKVYRLARVDWCTSKSAEWYDCSSEEESTSGVAAWFLLPTDLPVTTSMEANQWKYWNKPHCVSID